MKKELIDFASKKIQLMSIGGAIVAGISVVCYTSLGYKVSEPSTTETLSRNCGSFEKSNRGNDALTKGTNCGGQIKPTKEQFTLQGLHIPLDLEKLFSAGDYNLNEKQKNELKNKDQIFRSLAQQRQILYIQGSADQAGNSHFIETLSRDSCANQADFNQIQHHALSGDNYDRQLSSQTIFSPITNRDLPQLRARSLQCWIKGAYPTLITEIIEGGIQSGTASQYRRVRIFTNDKFTASKPTFTPSPD